MNLRPHLLLAALVVALPPTTPAQSPQRPGDPVFAAEPAAGSREGTQRWIVHFATRPFTLDALTAEYRGAADPAKVAAIVGDLEERMKAHQAPFVAQIEKLDGKVLRQLWLVNACTIEIAPKHLVAVRDLENVAFLQPDGICAPFAPIKTATDANNHHADELQALGVTGAGVAIAITDSGHDSNMAGTGKPHIIYSEAGSPTLSRLLFNKAMGSQPADDVAGHGTAVDSCAAGWKWFSPQADQGHAYGAKIAGYAIADFANGNTFETTQAAAWQQVVADAAANKIKVGNLSYAGNPDPLGVAPKAIDAAALTADILVCTAAGNSGTDISGSHVNLNGLSVGAVSPGTHVLASFSGTGSMAAGGTFPDLVANGVGIAMALRDSEFLDNNNSGTSFACPMVAGAAALLRAANPALKAIETKAILLASTEASASSSTTQVQGVGCGYLRDDQAYKIATTPQSYGRGIVSASAPRATWQLRVKLGQAVQIAIAWNRMDTSKADFSDLDLRLMRGSTELAKSNTSKNSEEFVRYFSVADEVLTVQVDAFAIRNTTQQEFAWATNVDNGDKIFNPVFAGPGFGSAIASAGDFNKDGYNDIVIGHPGASNGVSANAGAIYVISGKDYSFLTGGTLQGPGANMRFGASVASADMNQDGFSDVVLGAPGQSAQGGVIWILNAINGVGVKFASSASPGLGELVAVAPYLDPDGFPDVVAVDNASTDLVAFSGITHAQMWRKTPISGVPIKALAVLGDVNGDGRDDIVLGFPTFNSGFGTIEVRSGKDGSVIRLLNGPKAEAFGSSVANAGDLNGDGVNDYVVGSPNHPNGGALRGLVTVFSGRTGVAFLIVGGLLDAGTLGTSVAGAGDVDGDGTPDLLVAALGPFGTVTVFSGKDGHEIQKLVGFPTGFGAAIAGVSTNGDDQPDFLIAESLPTPRVHLYDAPAVASPPAYFEYGVPCVGSSGAYPRCGFSGPSARIGRSTTVTLASAPKSSASVCQLGATRAAIDLTVLGLTGCQSLTPATISLSKTTTALGEASLTLAIPMSSSLVGAPVHFQWISTDLGKGGLPLALSTGGTARIGGQ